MTQLQIDWDEVQNGLPNGKVKAFEGCLAVMKTAGGLTAEKAFHLLLQHGHLYAPELIDAFRESKYSDFWILELLIETKSAATIPVLIECIGTSDTYAESDSCRASAYDALRLLLREYGIKLVRQLLFEMEMCSGNDLACFHEFWVKLVNIGDLIDLSRVSSQKKISVSANKDLIAIENIQVFQVIDASEAVDAEFIAVMGRALAWITVGDVLRPEKGGAAYTVYQIEAFGKEVDKASPFVDCRLTLEGSGRLRDGDILTGVSDD